MILIIKYMLFFDTARIFVLFFVVFSSITKRKKYHKIDRIHIIALLKFPEEDLLA